MTVTSHAPRFKCATKPVKDIEKIYESLQSDIISQQIWAIEQLPPIPNQKNSQYAEKCYSIISDNVLKNSYEYSDAVAKALQREMKTGALRSNKKFMILSPIIFKMLMISDEHIWLELLENIFTFNYSPEVKEATVQKLISLFTFDSTEKSLKILEYAISGFCKSKATIPDILIDKIIKRKTVLQCTLKPLLANLSVNCSDCELKTVYRNILASNLQESYIIDAACSMDVIPEPFLLLIRSIVGRVAVMNDTAASLVKNANVLMSNNLLTFKKLLSIVFKSNLFRHKYHNIVSEFLAKSINMMSIKDVTLYLVKLIESKNPNVMKLIPSLLINTRDFMSDSLDLFSVVTHYMFNNYKKLYEWCQTFNQIIQVVDADNSRILTNKLIQMIVEELEVGHKSIYADSINVIGHKQLAVMIDSLSYTPNVDILINEGMKYIQKAIKVFTSPLVQPVSNVMIRISIYEEPFMTFMKTLCEGNAQEKVMFCKICSIISYHIDHVFYLKNLFPLIIDLTSSKQVSVVRFAAISALPSISYFEKHFFTDQFINGIYDLMGKLRATDDPAISLALEKIPNFRSIFASSENVPPSNVTVCKVIPISKTIVHTQKLASNNIHLPSCQTKLKLSTRTPAERKNKVRKPSYMKRIGII